MSASYYDFSRLRDDFPYYAESLLRIRNKAGLIVPFKLKEEQLRLDRIFSDSVKRHKTIIFVLKARQPGISTWAEGRLFHRSHMFSNSQSVIMAHDMKTTEYVFDITNRYYDYLPTQPVNWKPMLRRTNRRELVFDNPNKKERGEDPGLGSTIDVYTAGTKTSARGFTGTAFHLSEFAFYPNGKELVRSAIPGLPNHAGIFAILETTPNGMDNFAYNVWQDYKADYIKNPIDCQTIPVFIPWFEVTEYTKPFRTDALRLELLETLDDEEKELIQKYFVTLEQLNWRRGERRMMGSEDSFRQEFAADDTSCWLSSGKPVFDQYKITAAHESRWEPVFKGEISHSGELADMKEGRFTLWKWPEANKRYLVSVDPRSDSEKKNADWGAVQIIDTDTLTQIGEWHGKLDSLAMSPYVKAIGSLVGNATNNYQAELVIERNPGGGGLSMLYEICKDYYNIYCMENFSDVVEKITSKMGWETNVRTKGLIVDQGEYIFNNNYAKINSVDLLKQMRGFVRTANSGAAKKGQHDDLVMSWLIGIFVASKDKKAFVSHKQAPYTGIEIEEQRTVVSALKTGALRSYEFDIDNLHDESREEVGSWMEL